MLAGAIPLLREREHLQCAGEGRLEKWQGKRVQPGVEDGAEVWKEGMKERRKGGKEGGRKSEIRATIGREEDAA